MFLHIDNDAFYCSCERLFRVALRNRPVVVASNNDGCAIARTKEAKALGIRMGHPVHELRALERSAGLVICSANFTLYGDISRRVATVVRAEVPRMQVYSIDEQFCTLEGIRDPLDFARSLRDKVQRWVGIPNCCGLARTKTLAKLGTRMAKKGAGVVDLTDDAARQKALAEHAVSDVWGVGSRWSARLQALGIATAADLAAAPADFILERFGVVLLRTQRELQGESCLSLEEVEPDRQRIIVSRSFGARVDDHRAVADAVATFAARACEKLRSRGLVAGGIQVFAGTDAFRPELLQHHPARAATLLPATDDTRLVLRYVTRLMDRMLRREAAYKRAGVMLLDLSRPQERQADLFAPAPPDEHPLMAVVDGINRRFGRGSVGFGATGWQRQPVWAMRQRNLSPCYTTRWSDLPVVRC